MRICPCCRGTGLQIKTHKGWVAGMRFKTSYGFVEFALPEKLKKVNEK